MHRNRFGLIAIVFWLLTATVGHAQPFDSPLIKQMLAGRVWLGIVAGRIVNTTTWQFDGQATASSNGTVQEHATCSGDGASGSLSYERTSPQEEAKLEISSDGRFYFCRKPKTSAAPNATDVPVEFVQTPHEPITLKIGAGRKQETYRAPTFWHLAIVQREICLRHVVPVLEKLRPQWQFARMTSAVETELLKLAAAGRQPEQRHWAALVDQLADARFSKREAADRQLRAAGLKALGYLRQVDMHQLDAEQQSRIRRIVKSFAQQTTDDTPDQAAALLVDDPAVWLALLARPEESTRRTAARQLATMLGEPIPVDPAAEPAGQAKNREELRVRLTRKRDEDGKAKAESGSP